MSGAKGNSFSLSGVCDDRGQHAADTAAAREPITNRLMQSGHFLRPRGSPSPFAALTRVPSAG